MHCFFYHQSTLLCDSLLAAWSYKRFYMNKVGIYSELLKRTLGRQNHKSNRSWDLCSEHLFSSHLCSLKTGHGIPPHSKPATHRNLNFNQKSKQFPEPDHALENRHRTFTSFTLWLMALQKWQENMNEWMQTKKQTSGFQTLRPTSPLCSLCLWWTQGPLIPTRVH